MISKRAAKKFRESTIHQKPWTANEEKQLVELYFSPENNSLRRIAILLGRSTNSVDSKLCELRKRGTLR